MSNLLHLVDHMRLEFNFWFVCLVKVYFNFRSPIIVLWVRFHLLWSKPPRAPKIKRFWGFRFLSALILIWVSLIFLIQILISLKTYRHQSSPLNLILFFDSGVGEISKIISIGFWDFAYWWYMFIHSRYVLIEKFVQKGT